MSLASIHQSPVDSDQAARQANAWLRDNHRALRGRAEVQFAGCEPERREECVCEVLALVTANVHRAARRGGLHRLSPSTCIHYAGKQVRASRRAAGASTTDALSESPWLAPAGGVASLDQARDRADKPDWHETLADRAAECPSDVARRRHDFALLLEGDQVSRHAKAVFLFLARSAGAGRQTELAAELFLTPGRITQLKDELAAALRVWDYQGPLTRRSPRRG